MPKVDKKLTQAQLHPPWPNRFGKLPQGDKMKTFLNMLRDESGASAAEYALILAIVGTAIAAAAIALGGSIATAMNTASDTIDAGYTGGAGGEDTPVEEDPTA